MSSWEKDYKSIEINAQKRDKWHAELDSVSLLVFEKDYNSLLEFTDNLYRSDTSRNDLLLKYGCINLCLQNDTDALDAICRLKSKISYKVGSDWIINKKEIMYYALTTESVILDKSLDSLLKEYSLTRKKEWILNDMDSIIAKQIYD